MIDCDNPAYKSNKFILHRLLLIGHLDRYWAPKRNRY